ncbi:hypothetical protein [Nocardia sp. bgisy118]|uniref:hypothetical protein n=1 Tax=Nocardia sp. bgisy118 TaxID=3413786 RepID=UPI003F49E795
MVVTITNLQATGPLTIPLASGRAVRLGPGERSPALPDADVIGNAKVDKLRSQRLIDVAAVSDASQDSAAGNAHGGETGKTHATVDERVMRHI